MARRYDTKEIRDTIGALDSSGVPVEEIKRRLAAGEAGLKCGSVKISRRQIYYYRQKYREENGPPARESEDEATVHSIESLEQRIINLLAREVTALEGKRRGTLKPEHSKALAAHHRSLSEIHNRRRPRGKATPGKSNGSGESQPSKESALERLAREQQEGAVTA